MKRSDAVRGRVRDAVEALGAVRGGPVGVAELAVHIGVHEGVVRDCLRQLVADGEVSFVFGSNVTEGREGRGSKHRPPRLYSVKGL